MTPTSAAPAAPRAAAAGGARAPARRAPRPLGAPRSPTPRPATPLAGASGAAGRPGASPPPARRTRARRPLAERAAAAFAGLVARLYLGRPDLVDAVSIRYRSLRAVLGGIGNELAYRLGLSRAPALLSANLELTNRCNLACTFCPTADGRMARPKGHMEASLFRRALDGAGRLEFALLFQWGEPLLHPRFAELAADASRRGIRTLVTTNGTLLDDGRIAALLEAGVDRVTVSVDGDATTHERVRGIPLARTRAAVERLVAARDAAGSSTAVDVSMVVAPETESGTSAFVEGFRALVDRVQTIPLLVRGARRTRCREPWRGGLVVLRDGRCTVCCADHDGALAVGDATKESLASIWNGERMRALRRDHAKGRLPAVCAGCSEYPTDAAAPRFVGPLPVARGSKAAAR